MPDKSARPGPEVRKKEILDAATEVFGRKNYNWATTKEIAKRAGLSERTLFFYFKTKKELYRAVINAATRELEQALVRGMPPQGDVRAFVKMSGRNFLAYLKEQPVKVKVLLQSLDVLGDPDMKGEFRRMMQELYQFVYSLLENSQKRGDIRKDLRVDTAAAQILGFYFIVCYAEFLDLDWFKGEHEDVFSVGDEYVDYLTGRESGGG